jgi:hypothetical protein
MTKNYLAFDGMCWPNPDDPDEKEWRLRHGTPTEADRMWAASVIGAYRQLIEDSGKVRDSKVRRIRTARDAERQAEMDTAKKPSGGES